MCVKLLEVKLLYVKVLHVKFVCVKLLYGKCACVREAAGGGGEGGAGTRDTESKTRTPHKDVGNKPPMWEWSIPPIYGEGRVVFVLPTLFLNVIKVTNCH